MKKYVQPEMEVITLLAVDILSESADDEMGWLLDEEE